MIVDVKEKQKSLFCNDFKNEIYQPLGSYA